MARLKLKVNSNVKKEATKKKAPVLRHIALAKTISENIRKDPAQKLSMKRAMIDAGYSPSYASSSTHLRSTNSWQNILDSVLSDEKLAAVHDRLLNAKQIKVLQFNHRIKDKEMKEIVEAEGFRFVGITRFMTTAAVRFIMPDTFAQNAALDKAYKLKQKYGAVTIKHQFGELSDAELEREASREISAALGSVTGEEEA